MKLFYLVNKPLAAVFNILSDMKKFETVHPVITRIEPLQADRYRVYETLRVCGIPLRFNYDAIVLASSDTNRITMEVKLVKNIRILIIYHLACAEVGTVVYEELLIQGPWLVRLLGYPIFKRQHQQLFRNIM